MVARLLIVLYLCGGLLLAAEPNQGRDIVMSAVWAKQPDAPMQITSMGKAIDNLAAKVWGKNVSGRAISEFTLSYSIVIPETCSTVVVAPRTERMATFHKALAARGEFEVDGKVPSAELRSWTEENHGHYVLIEVGVSDVVFADGTTWSATLTG